MMMLAREGEWYVFPRSYGPINGPMQSPQIGDIDFESVIQTKYASSSHSVISPTPIAQVSSPHIFTDALQPSIKVIAPW